MGLIKDPRQLRHLKVIRELKGKLWQFGQPDDETTGPPAFNGSHGCTQNDLRALDYIVQTEGGLDDRHAELLTADEVSIISGYGPRFLSRGLWIEEVERFCERRGLPYVVEEAPWGAIQFYLDHEGPVMGGTRYGSWPRRKGARYKGLVATAPFAISGGADQLSGAKDVAHAVLFLARAFDPAIGKSKLWALETNRNSAARPDPKTPYGYDIVLENDAAKAYGDFTRAPLSRDLYALRPTRRID